MLDEIKQGIILSVPFLGFFALVFFGVAGVAICTLSAVCTYIGVRRLELRIISKRRKRNTIRRMQVDI